MLRRWRLTLISPYPSGLTAPVQRMQPDGVLGPTYRKNRSIKGTNLCADRHRREQYRPWPRRTTMGQTRNFRPQAKQIRGTLLTCRVDIAALSSRVVV